MCYIWILNTVYILKKILIIISVFLLANVIYLKSHIFKKNRAEVIISVDNLLTNQVINSIEKDLNNYSNIRFIEGSLLTGVVILEVVEDDLEISSLDSFLFSLPQNPKTPDEWNNNFFDKIKFKFKS